MFFKTDPKIDFHFSNAYNPFIGKVQHEAETVAFFTKFFFIMTDDKLTHTYQGYEQGPIYPANDAYSLLLRLIRNCPWNRCSFCPVYKKQKFSIRSVEDIIKDIDLVRTYIDRLLQENALPIAFEQERIHSIYTVLRSGTGLHSTTPSSGVLRV